ncbi:polymer-forming cytoskeletal protein [Shimia thalassica]|uniref:bactofilin family protein n=1 Tax=Shimia thalassica TaxID=1715693 RepID=UPI002732B4FC|nr:polymer-forming cytoskeletal protein [Shimia thalassica]MDP2582086.1 polymer-forming cytoskeletal protein [Shimia thalassica]
MAKTIIAEGLQVIGNISGTADIDVFGHVEGDIVGSSIDILAGGQVSGSINVESAHLRGHLTGALKATSVEIHAGALCNADIDAKELETRKGATIRGTMSITFE